jgi:hypothetical protein
LDVSRAEAGFRITGKWLQKFWGSVVDDNWTTIFPAIHFITDHLNDGCDNASNQRKPGYDDQKFVVLRSLLPSLPYGHGRGPGVGPQVRLKELGLQTLKGFAEPVHVYEAELVVPGFSRSSTQKSGLVEQRPPAHNLTQSWCDNRDCFLGKPLAA